MSSVSYHAKLGGSVGKLARPAVRNARAKIPKAMIDACREGRVDQVRSLIDERVSVNGLNDETQERPLTAAAAAGQMAVVRLLLDAGADVNSESGGLHRHTCYTALHLAAIAGQAKVVRELHGRGAKVMSYGFCTAMEYAAYSGDAKTVKLMLSLGAKATKPALLNAVRTRRTKIVKMLVKAGALERVSATGETPVEWAAYADKSDILNIFLAAGLPFDVPAGFLRETPLMVACLNSKSDACALRLIKRGANVNRRAKTGRTPLHYAAQGGSERLIRALIAAGADPNAKDKAGDTPQDLADRWPANLRFIERNRMLRALDDDRPKRRKAGG